MRWVLMLFVVLAAVMGGEARAVVVTGRVAVSEWVGKDEKAAEALRVESDRSFQGADEATGLVDGGPLVCWFPGGLAVARSDALSGTGTTGCRRVSSTAWRYDLADNRVARTETEERRVVNSTSWVRTAAADQRCLYRNAEGTGPNGRNQLSQSWETRTRWDAESGAPLELSEQTVSYRYDPRGNRTRRTTRLWKQARTTGSSAWPVPTVTDSDEALEWDGENRLTGMWRGPWKEELAQVPFESLVGEAVAGSTVWRWGYDHRSRRVQRDEPGSGGERLRTVTVFAGGTSAAEYAETAAGSEWTVPPAATVQHVRGPDLGGGTKGLLYSLRNGLPTFNRYNGRGDVVAQSDIDGTTTWAASYQADGRRTSEAGTNVERHRANCLPKATRSAASGLVFQAAFAAGRSKEEDPTGLLNEGFRYRDMETGTFISRDPLGLVDGPNVYCYVRQNPWTMWDPEGLETVAQHTANAEWAAKNGKYLDMLACTFMGWGRAINPADAKSELRNASAQMPALVDNARKEINNPSIPAPLKIVAKAALATAGNAEPLQLLEGGVQVKNTVHTHGLSAPGVMLDGIKKAASEDPVYFISQLTSGFLMGGGGKILSKPGSGVLAPKTPLNGPLRGPCFAAGTLVSTPEGEKPIEEVKEGDSVFAYDFAIAKVVEKTVTKLNWGETRCWIHVVADTGDKIKATRFHPFWVENRQTWIEALDLEPGMVLRLKSGKLAKVLGVTAELLEHPEATFNFEVADVHNYFVASGVLVHNGGPPSPEQLLGIELANKSASDSAQAMQLGAARNGERALRQAGLWQDGFRMDTRMPKPDLTIPGNTQHLHGFDSKGNPWTMNVDGTWHDGAPAEGVKVSEKIKAVLRGQGWGC